MALGIFPSYQKVFPYLDNNTVLVTNIVTSGHTAKFDVTFGGGTDLFSTILTPDFNGSVTLYLDYIIQNYFNTQVFTNSTGSTFQYNPNALLQVDITCSEMNGNTVVQTISANGYYAMNAVVQGDELFNISDYIISSTHVGRFLSKYTYERLICLDSKAYLNCLIGNYGTGLVSAMSGITVTAYQNDGSTKTLTINNTITFKCVCSIDVSITRINVIQTGFIDNNTVYYTVKEKNGYSETIKFNIVREQKVKNNYNVLYVNSLGATDYQDFVKSSQKDLEITRNTFVNNSIKKVYSQDIQNKISVNSDWLDENQSAALQDLWNSPVIKISNNGKFYDAVLNTDSITIMNRFQSKLISYAVDFSPAQTYKSLK